MQVADDVERSTLVAAIAQAGGLRHDAGAVGCRGAAQDVHRAEPLRAQPRETPRQTAGLVRDHGAADAARALPVVGDAGLDGQVQHDGDGGQATSLGHGDEEPAGPGIDAGGIEHRQKPAPQALVRHPVGQGEGAGAHALVGGVACEQSAAVVRADRLGGTEGAPAEARLAGPGGAHHDHEAGRRDLEVPGPRHDASARKSGGRSPASIRAGP